MQLNGPNALIPVFHPRASILSVYPCAEVVYSTNCSPSLFLLRIGVLFSTGSKDRTLIDGFGDHYVTITPNPHTSRIGES